jgi:hypothetical protein
MALYTHSSIGLHGVVVNWLSTGTALPFSVEPVIFVLWALFCPTFGGSFLRNIRIRQAKLRHIPRRQ